MSVPDRPLLRRFPGLSLPRVPLLAGPTPVRRVTELEAEIGAAGLWLKDDGRSAPPYGGNKPRKLEWLLGAARAAGRTRVLSIGADGSNYCLATAIHGTRAGFTVELLVSPQPPTDGVRRNIELALGAGATYAAAGGDAGLLWRWGRRALFDGSTQATWFGGSSPLGTVGFVDAALELAEQVASGELPPPDVIVLPTGSVGSHAGLVLGLRLAGLPIDVVGVRVTPKILGNAAMVAAVANRTSALLHRADPTIPRIVVKSSEIRVHDGFFGEGYGVLTPASAAAMERAQAIGLTLDPTYSSKAFAAALTEPTLAGRTVLFWNTYNACSLDDLPRGDPATLPAALRRRAFGA